MANQAPLDAVDGVQLEVDIVFLQEAVEVRQLADQHLKGAWKPKVRLRSMAVLSARVQVASGNWRLLDDGGLEIPRNPVHAPKALTLVAAFGP